MFRHDHTAATFRSIICISAVFLVALTSCDEVDNEYLSPEALEAVNKVDWWKRTNYYHLYLRSFQDSDGDGNGDLRGVLQRLDYLQHIGIETVLMAPFYSSPMRDGGYDIDDYRAVNPMCGTMQDFEDLAAEMHRRNMYLVIDFVPNHSPDLHEWFKCSERAYLEPERCGKYKDYYVWIKPTLNETGQPDLSKPPNNWISVFGDQSAWTFSELRKEWYLRQFTKEQPDMNFRNQAVREEFKDIVRFWLRKGADGLRIDALMHVFEDEQLRDEPDDPRYRPQDNPPPYFRLKHIYTRGLPESLAIVRDWRQVAEEPEFANPVTGKSRKVFIGETYGSAAELLPSYGPSPDDKYIDMPFNIELLDSVKEPTFSAERIEHVVFDRWLTVIKAQSWPREDGVPMPVSNWVTGNHDNMRMASRVGRSNAIVYMWISYMLPSVPITYSGDELHLLNARQDRISQRTLDEGEASRLASRAPMPWDPSEPSGGFSSSADTWMPLDEDYKENNVQTLLSPKSGRNHLKAFAKMADIKRRNLPVFLFGDLVFFGTGDRCHIRWLCKEKPEDSRVLAMARTSSEYGNIMLLANTDRFWPAVVRLSRANSFYDEQLIEPPETATVLTVSIDAPPVDGEPTGQFVEGQEVRLDDLTLAPSQGLLLKF